VTLSRAATNSTDAPLPSSSSARDVAYAEARGDILGPHTFLLMQLGEGLVLIGGMHLRPHRVPGEVDLGGVMFGVEDAADRLLLL
jgi:hypothetical protein